MPIEIQARSFVLTEEMTVYIERRIRFTFASRFDQIQYIRIVLYDVNGPRGGIDKCCCVRVVLPHLRDVIIEDTEVNLYTAIDRAVGRAGRTVNRRLERQHKLKRKTYVPHKAELELVVDNTPIEKTAA
jgi:ribosome-associated translation inhibitor RaiA